MFLNPYVTQLGLKFVEKDRGGGRSHRERFASQILVQIIAGMEPHDFNVFSYAHKQPYPSFSVA